MDDERLKNPSITGVSKVPDYFDGMLERIRDRWQMIKQEMSTKPLVINEE